MKTLKISDLSAGDWVRYNGKKCTIASIYMAAVGHPHEVALTHQGVCCGWVYIDHLDPIPITAEILEKNGFVEDNNGHYALKIGGIVAVDIEYTGGIWELSILDVYALQYAGKMQVTIAFVSSIHNLQHALRLAGIDEEIAL